MSLYSYDFQLLPRPPRSVLSIGSDATRATLPNFADVNALSQFTSRLFNWQIKILGFYEQVIVAACVCALIVIAVGLILSRKVYEGRFWLARLIRRPTGVIVVANPMLSFLLLSGLHGIIFTPWFVIACRRYTHTSNDPPPHNVILWITLPMLALACALKLVVLGTYFALPSAFPSAADESKVPAFRRFFARADVMNAVSLVCPLSIAIMITIPAVIANNEWQKAVGMEAEWQQRYASLPAFTQEMVQQSQRVWFQALKGAKLASIVFVLWTITAFGLCFAYVYLATRLIAAVRADIHRSREQSSRAATQTIVEEEPVVISQIIKQALEANRANQLRRSSLIQAPSHTLSTPSHQAGLKAGLNTQQSFSTQRIVVDAATTKAASEKQQHSKEKDQSEQDSQTEGTAASNPSKALEDALFQIYLQTLTVGPGSLCIGAATLALSLTLHSKLEQPSNNGGNLFEIYIGAIWLFLIYTTCVLGALSFSIVAFKTFEPVVASSKTLQVASQIRFRDIAKGPSHIRSTFFDVKSQATDQTLPLASSTSSPVLGKELLETVKNPRYDSIIEEEHSPEDENSLVVIPYSSGGASTPSWDVEAEPLGYSMNASLPTSSPSPY